MRTNISVSLNGVPLDSIDKSIITQDITEDTPAMNVATASRFGTYGQRVTTFEKRSTQVTVKFNIAERDLERRYLIAEKVRAWAANGGRLTLSCRPDRFLSVVCTALPGIEFKNSFDQEYAIRLTAFAVPEWQSIMPFSASVTEETDVVTKAIVNQGTAPTKLRFKLSNNSGKVLDECIVTVNGKHIELTGMSVPNGSDVTLTYTDDDIMQIRCGADSLLDKRTADSADDLWLTHGANSVMIITDVPVTAMLTAIGRWY